MIRTPLRATCQEVDIDRDNLSSDAPKAPLARLTVADNIPECDQMKRA